MHWDFDAATNKISLTRTITVNDWEVRNIALSNDYIIATTEDKKKLFALPNFDAEIFKEITGIDVENKVKVVCDGKEVWISRESAEAIFKEKK